MPAPSPDAQKAARAELWALYAAPATLRVIHYSCESLDDRNDGRSPRITSIAVRNVQLGQVRSFSIHQMAEEQHIAMADIEAHYDALELAMLNAFSAYIGQHGDAHYLHWNMRDANYGFDAIAHRHRVLGGAPSGVCEVREDRRHDLANLLQSIYGNEYIGHPRLPSLLAFNDITEHDFLSGAQEAQAFTDRNYVALHKSTLRKVDVIAAIAERTHRKTLKTMATFWVQNGGNVRGLWFWLVENKSIGFVGLFVGIILGAASVWFVIVPLTHPAPPAIAPVQANSQPLQLPSNVNPRP